MHDELSDNLEPVLSLDLKKASVDDDVPHLKQRIHLLEEQLRTAEHAATEMLLDLLTLEKVAEDRLTRITELEAASEQAEDHGSASRFLPVFEFLENPLGVKVGDAERGNVEPSTNSSPSPAQRKAESMSHEPPKNSKHEQEVAELKRLLDFYKKNCERTTYELEELGRREAISAAREFVQAEAELGAAHDGNQ